MFFEEFFINTMANGIWMFCGIVVGLYMYQLMFAGNEKTATNHSAVFTEAESVEVRKKDLQQPKAS